jgi:zinc/manganese transport system permease protein
MFDELLSFLVEPGFFENEPVQTALVLGGGAAVVCGVVGFFAVLRGQSFATHSLSDVSSAGGAAAPLLGIDPLLGFLGISVLAGWAMEIIGLRGGNRERDLMTGVVLSAGLGAAALFLYLDVTFASSRTGVTSAIMFGSMFTVPASTILPAVIVSAVALAVVAALYRPLLLTSLSPELARVQGVPVRWINLAQLAALGLAAALSAVTIGAILSTALLIGPAAAAVNVARRPAAGVLLAVLFGLTATWGGILMAYDSYYWTPGHSWPVSFCVVLLILLLYLASTARRAGKVAPAAARAVD